MQKMMNGGRDDNSPDDCLIELDVSSDVLLDLGTLLRVTDPNMVSVSLEREYKNLVTDRYDDYTPMFALSTSDIIISRSLQKLGSPHTFNQLPVDSDRLKRMHISMHEFCIAVLETKLDVYADQDILSDEIEREIHSLMVNHENMVSSLKSGECDSAFTTNPDAHELTENPFDGESAPESDETNDTPAESTLDESTSIDVNVRSRQLDDDPEPFMPFSSDDVDPSDVEFDSRNDMSELSSLGEMMGVDSPEEFMSEVMMDMINSLQDDIDIEDAIEEFRNDEGDGDGAGGSDADTGSSTEDE